MDGFMQKYHSALEKFAQEVSKAAVTYQVRREFLLSKFLMKWRKTLLDHFNTWEVYVFVRISDCEVAYFRLGICVSLPFIFGANLVDSSDFLKYAFVIITTVCHRTQGWRLKLHNRVAPCCQGIRVFTATVHNFIVDACFLFVCVFSCILWGVAQNTHVISACGHLAPHPKRVHHELHVSCC